MKAWVVLLLVLLASPFADARQGSTTDHWIDSLEIPAMGSSSSFWDGPRRVGVVFEVELDSHPSEVLSDRVKSRLWERLLLDVGVDDWVLLDEALFVRDGPEVTARNAGVRDFVHVSIREDAGYVELELEHRRGYLYFWERVRGLGDAGSAVFHTRVPKDVEINALLFGEIPKWKRLRLRKRPLELGGSRVQLEGLGVPLDVAVASLDEDEHPEHLFLFQDRLLMLNGKDGKASTSLFHGLRRSPGVSRSRSGTLVVWEREEGATLLIHCSDYTGWIHVEVDAQGDVVSIRQVDDNGPYVAPFSQESTRLHTDAVVLAARVAGTDFFGGPMAEWTSDGIQLEFAEEMPRFYRYQRYSLKKAEVGEWEVWEAFSRLDGSLCVRQTGESGCATVVKNVGATFQILDFDQDGRLDIMNSGNDLKEDRWRVVQDRGQGRLKYYAWKDSDPIAAMTATGGIQGRERVVFVTYGEDRVARAYTLEVVHE